jgi:D-psicose/D-tagatose/L-ribulose 3-epimerase
MNIGVSAFAWTADLKTSHLDLLPALRDHGLTAFEVPMFDPATLPAAQIRQATAASDLICTVCAILPHGINPISPDPAVRRASIDHLTRCIHVAAEMGAHLLGGPLYAPIGFLPPHRRTEDQWTWAVEAFHALTPALEANDVTLSLEPVNRSETLFLSSAQDAKSLCQAINHPRIGVTIDTFHANIEEKNIAAAIRSLGPWLKHMHMSENDRGLLGSGHVDFPGIVSALRDVGYTGLLMIEGFGFSAAEPHAPGALLADLTVSPEDIAFKGERYLRSLLP